MSIITALSRLCITNVSIRSISTGTNNLFRATPILCAEPLKKKKKVDPQVIRAREERRRKKLEKQIRRLEKNARQLKPIDELEVPLVLIDEKDKRTRNVNIATDVLEKRAILEKIWARYQHEQKLHQYKTVDRILMSQEKALQELRFESEQLYQEAVQPDPKLLPFYAKGPVVTPPVEHYDSPDGDYIDISKKWE